MRKNRLKEIWKAGGVVTNSFLHIPNTWTAELMAHAGWDSVTVDMQHGLHGIETAIQMMQAVSTNEYVTPLARSSWNDPSNIMRLLDGGAYGIVCPMINTGEECEAFVGACYYPPLGYRSLGPTRARLYGGDDYGEFANEEILTFAMIETKEAVANIDAINSVKGLDAIFVGSGDLMLSYTGKASHGNNSEYFDEAIITILDSCKKHNIIPGIWCASIADAQKQMQKGFRFVALKSDSMMLNDIARQSAKDLKNCFLS
jgi:4-hydroxy-2-oxoheptanedioate aldolase